MKFNEEVEVKTVEPIPDVVEIDEVSQIVHYSIAGFWIVSGIPAS